MSMPNFNTMRNFPLYVRDFVSEVDYCPACNTYGEDGVSYLRRNHRAKSISG